MESQEKAPKRKAKPIFRINLSDHSKEILDRWRSQLRERCLGIKISDAELVNWCLSSTGRELSKKHLDIIKDEYFDEVKQLQWMLLQARVAKAKGEKISLTKKLSAVIASPEISSTNLPTEINL